MTLIGEMFMDGVDVEMLAPGEIVERETRHIRTEEGEGRTYEKRYLAVGDVSRREDRERLSSEIDIQNAILKMRPEWPIPTAENGYQRNPVSEWFYLRYPEKTSMDYWRNNHMPYAEALYPLQRLNDAGRHFPGGVVDDYAMDIFINHVDSVAIRARGFIYKEAVLKKVSEMPGQTLRAVALGAGAGVPNIDATIEAMKSYGVEINWDMYDLRYKPLEDAKELAEEAGLPENSLTTHRKHYNKAFSLEDESADIFDVLGLMEYLERDECVEIIRQGLRILKSGGLLAVSNMRTDRPQLDFNQRGALWPGVVPRSEEELIQIAVEAGVAPEDITISVSDDGVYSFMEIRKP